MAADLNRGDVVARDANGRMSLVKHYPCGSVSIVPIAFKNLEDYANWLIRNANRLPENPKHTRKVAKLLLSQLKTSSSL
jgi:hypothetical protein